jgi:dihydroorotate dehydrogenase electron transfer subunit
MRFITSYLEDIIRLKRDVYLLSFFSSYLAKKSQPGQFLHVRVHSSLALRRPFSVHKVEGSSVFILFKVRGRGTLLLSRYRKGQALDIIGPLGNGFNHQSPITNHQSPILVGGGMGVAPLVFLAQKISKVLGLESRVSGLVLLGVKNRNEILCKDDFKRLGFRVLVATEDGSIGFRGTVIELLKRELLVINPQQPTKIYACGPKEMFYELADILADYPQIECETSFEQFMGCGIGACLGCVIKTRQGYKRVCKDGPVFDIRDVLGSR